MLPLIPIELMGKTASLVFSTPHGHSRHSPGIDGVCALPFGADDVVRLPRWYSRISYVSEVMKQVELSTCEQRGGRQSPYAPRQTRWPSSPYHWYSILQASTSLF